MAHAGGGLNEDESAEDGARRELWEETGLETGELRAVWDRRHAFRWRGRNHEQREGYFLGRFDAPSVKFTALEEFESQQLLALRWWQAEAIRASDEIFMPRRLGEQRRFCAANRRRSRSKSTCRWAQSVVRVRFATW